VEGIRLLLSVLISLSLSGDRMDDDRPVIGLRALDCRLDLPDVMAIDRADVLEPELLEEHPGDE
jgi:hypothetical protein